MVTTWTRLALDAAGALVIGIGTVVALAELPSAVRGRRRFTQLRLDLARYLALALELQLASDILQTAIAPSWAQLGQRRCTELSSRIGERPCVGYPRSRSPEYSELRKAALACL